MTTLATLTAGAARRWPDRVALVFDEHREQLTFADVDRRSTAIANALAGLGVGPGDRVALMLPNRSAFPLTWLALAKLRAVMVPVNVGYREVDAGYLVGHSAARLAVTEPAHVPVLRGLAPLDRIVSVDPAEGMGPTLDELATAAGDAPTNQHPVAEDLVNLQYTSGTTGPPKGCMLSQGYWEVMCRGVADYASLGPDDVVLTAQPFSYMDPQWNVVLSLVTGARLVVLDRFHPSTFWSQVRSYGVTFFYCLGVMPTLLLKMPVDPGVRDHRLRMATCSAIPARQHAELEERFGVAWYEVFGMTETGIDLAVPPDEHDALVGSSCIGRPLPHREARVVDTDDRPVPRGGTGELLLRGRGMMDGYYRDPQATAATFRNGWLHTGDVARMDTDGRIYYVGRRKEMIRRSGENISATEVEKAIELHPAVVGAACVPVPDEVRGEEVKAYVVLGDGHTPEAVPPDGLVAFCAERVARFKVPRYWEYRDRLPLTPSEKVAKHVLRDERPDLRQGAYDAAEQRWR